MKKHSRPATRNDKRHFEDAVLRAAEITPAPLSIYLYKSHALGLIVPCKTGVFYGNQVGGYATQHPSVEGYYVPLRQTAEELENYFWDVLGGYCMDGLASKDADRVDDILQQYGLFPAVRVEGMKLKSSKEAWIYVRLAGP